MVEYVAMWEALDSWASEYGDIALVLLGILGACVGSFLNVVVYRLPRGLSVQKPRRSFCPTCGAAIPWYLNIPLISWLMLRGKSACCHTRIAVRYFLLELACMLLFLLIGWYFEYEALPTQLALCLWAAALLALLVMDAEQMVVHPAPALFAAGCGLAAAAGDPAFTGASVSTIGDALLHSLGGALGGFALFRLVAWGGRLAFGRKVLRLTAPERWQLCQVGDDIVLSLAGKQYRWSEIFSEANCRVLLEDAEIQQFPTQAGRFTLLEDAVITPDGARHELEAYEQLCGSCTALTLHREAMGSGDAWLALAIGALLGWQGALFALVGGSFIGLFIAGAMRIGRGVPMPFGPALISAAYLWLFFAPEIIAFLLRSR